MLKLPKVFVGVPTFNRLDNLAQALDNLKIQTYRNLYIFVSDNASNDINAWENIVDKYKGDIRFKFYRQKKNIGFIENSRFLLSMADGKYFMWAADDDIIDKTFIEKAVIKLEENPKAVISFAGWEVEDLITSPPIRRDFSNFVNELPSADRYIRLRNYLVQPDYYGKARILWGLIRLDALNKCYSLAYANVFGCADLTMAELPVEFYLMSEGDLVLVPEKLFTFRLLPSSEGLREGAIFNRRELEMCSRTYDAYARAVKTFELSHVQKKELNKILFFSRLKSITRIIPYYFIRKYSPTLARICKWIWFRLLVK